MSQESMKKDCGKRVIRGQVALEYLLLLAVVAVVVIAAFGPGALVDKVHDSAQSYYNTVARVIMDSDNSGLNNPNPIQGHWCPVTCPTQGGYSVIYSACECPAPAFGGQCDAQTEVAGQAGGTYSAFKVNCPGAAL
ncbi:MAG: class III signal peptide-containing protein [Candidatus Omnitrophica bacterium]|nr:class III signal peptide-containing protein [Candidatus Omnitrophota bacterium]